MKAFSQKTLLLLMLFTCLVSFGAGSTCNGATLYQRSINNIEEAVKRANPQDFTFVVMGDSKDSDAVFRKALQLSAAYKPLFILHEGDVSEQGSPLEIDHFLELVQQNVPDIPFFVVPGNHEQTATFADKIGPASYVLDIPRLDLRLVVEDNSKYRLTPAQIDRLRTLLAPQRKFRFVAMHIPPRTKRWSWHTFTEGAPEFIDLVAGKKVTAVFYGHVHLFDRAEMKGVPHIITAGTGAHLVRGFFPGDPSYHIVVVRVREGAMTATMVKIPD